jgi:F-type H+-transporting ATPase subunit b
MIEGLRKREENIRGALEQAEKTRQEAMELQSRLDAKMKAAGADIARMMDEARRDAVGVKEQMVAEAREEIQKERDRLYREIGSAKDQALQEIWQQSVQLAAIMSAKAVRRSISVEDHRRLLDESLKELQQAGGGFAKRTVAGAGL